MILIYIGVLSYTMNLGCQTGSCFGHAVEDVQDQGQRVGVLYAIT